MEFKDLFVKQRPPKDYVSYPPQETPTLEKFFQERTNKPVPSPIEQTIAAPRMKFNPPKESPVEEQELQQIKQQYSLQEPSQQQDQQSVSTSEVSSKSPYLPLQPVTEEYSYQTERSPANESQYNLDYISQMADRMTPKNTVEDYLPALAPAILGALGGGRGQGFKIAGDYLAGKVGEEKAKKQRLEDMLLSMEKERQKQLLKKTKGSDKLYEAVDEQGNSVWMTREQAIGSGLIPKSSAAYDRAKQAELNRKQAKELADRTFGQNLRKELIKDPEFIKQRTRYSATNDAINILNQRNPVGDAGVTMIFAKGIFGEVGNLTAQENARFVGSPAYERSWDRLVEKYLKTGKLDESDRTDLLDLAVAMRDASKDSMKQYANRYTQSTGALGFDTQKLFDPLLDTSDIPPKYQEFLQKSTSKKVNRAMQPSQQKGSKFPMIMRKGGNQATISNENEYNEAYSEGWR